MDRGRVRFLVDGVTATLRLLSHVLPLWPKIARFLRYRTGPLATYGIFVSCLVLAVVALALGGFVVDGRRHQVVMVSQALSSLQPPYTLAADRTRFARWVVETVCPDAASDPYHEAPGGRAVAACCVVTRDHVWLQPRPDLRRGDSGSPLLASDLARLLNAQAAEAVEPNPTKVPWHKETTEVGNLPVRNEWLGTSVGCDAAAGTNWVKIAPASGRTSAQLAQELRLYQVSVGASSQDWPVGTGPFFVEDVIRVPAVDLCDSGSGICLADEMRKWIAQRAQLTGLDSEVLESVTDLVVLRSREDATRVKRVAIVGIDASPDRWLTNDGLRNGVSKAFDRGNAQVFWGLPEFPRVRRSEPSNASSLNAWRSFVVPTLAVYAAVRGYGNENVANTNRAWWKSVGLPKLRELGRDEAFLLKHRLVPPLGALPPQIDRVGVSSLTNDELSVPSPECICVRATSTCTRIADAVYKQLGLPLHGEKPHLMGQDDPCSEESAASCLVLDVAAWVVESRPPVFQIEGLVSKLGWAPDARTILEEVYRQDAAQRWWPDAPTDEVAPLAPRPSAIAEAGRAISTEMVQLGTASMVSWVADGLRGYYPQESQEDPFEFGLEPHIDPTQSRFAAGLAFLVGLLAATFLVGVVAADTRYRAVGFLARFARHEVEAPLASIKSRALSLPESGPFVKARSQILAEVTVSGALLRQGAWILQNPDALEQIARGRCEFVGIIEPLEKELRNWAVSEEIELDLQVHPRGGARGAVVGLSQWAAQAAVRGLLRNALDYRVGRTANVQVIAEIDKKRQLRLIVEDWGQGIAPAVREEDLYRVGQRAGRTGGGARGGYGFGLSVTRTLVAFVGGKVRLTNRKDPTRFEIVLPVVS